ncbi:hypothetical protein BN1080_00799 [Planococcus massiliensis]|uniref:Uncharacterized protein n=1 Tax=Planococcus massiliensis TaxID=1499687 RepID=A0A098EJ92_9BACL|nr:MULTISPECIES: hypothetical protein [Planococcus]MCJ1908129.1 hypothetical protein [Planococcus ruber]GKW45478.1 hypothetical protein NCCP2050_11700 [Planococcus sp. NCCP-2050]CEG21880.1 hypothetical protein BN1080_00799 [Planococcus massiliensis]
MADLREKIKTISSTKGDHAPESAKRIGLWVIAAMAAAVSILTFIIAIGLFRNGNWILAAIASLFFLLSAATAYVLAFPHKLNTM